MPQPIANGRPAWRLEEVLVVQRRAARAREPATACGFDRQLLHQEYVGARHVLEIRTVDLGSLPGGASHVLRPATPMDSPQASIPPSYLEPAGLEVRVLLSSCEMPQEQ